LGQLSFGSIENDIDIPESSADIVITSDILNWTGDVPVRTTGNLKITPTLGNSFSSTFNTGSLRYIGISGLTIGNISNTAGITIGSEVNVDGTIEIYGGDIALDNSLISNGSDISLYATGDVTQKASIRSDGLALNGAGRFSLNHQGNNVKVIAGGNEDEFLGNLKYTDGAEGLKIGEVGSNKGIFSDGIILIETLQGDIEIFENIISESEDLDAIILNSGKSSLIGDIEGGDIKILAEELLILAGEDGIVKLFSGSEENSDNLSDFVGKDNLRFSIDETTTEFKPQLENGEIYALFRESGCQLEEAGYAGVYFASTPSVKSGLADVFLAATVKLEEGADLEDIQVRFVNLELDPSNNGYYLTGWLSPQPVEGQPGLGSVSASVTLNIGNDDSRQFNIGIVEERCGLVGDEEGVLVTVSRPLDDFVTGGGYILESKSAGKFTADGGSKINFGYNVKFNRKMTNLKGNTNIIFRTGGRVYQIKANNFRSLSASDATATHPVHATFTARANIFDITDAQSELTVASQRTLVVVMTDRKTPAGNGKQLDDISFTLWDEVGSLLFSSNWDGGSTFQQRLERGNIQINQPGFSSGTALVGLSLVSDAENQESLQGSPVSFTASLDRQEDKELNGRVTFMSGDRVLGDLPVSGGKASFNTQSLSAGFHRIWVYYSGDDNFAPSSTEEEFLDHTVIGPEEDPKEEVPVDEEPNKNPVEEEPEEEEPAKEPKGGKGGKGKNESKRTDGTEESEIPDTTMDIAAETPFGVGGFKIKAYPNPGAGRYTIMVEGFEEGMLEVGIYSIQGQRLSTTSAEYNRRSRSFELDITPQAAGFYLLEVKQGYFRVMTRLIKQ